uniref:Structural maintenance of chromosomes protein 6-like n=1 Tax=Saccoglossus kowalevskii TaxID=10224 RepID=A0ABM0MG53_SACKO|nr:PREDICTED: structural maintenance of chromosomes protein 6-like [Saccoglossus kowalevskii]
MRQTFRRVESVLLIADNQDARTCMRTCPPQNCREAFTLVGDQVHAGAEQRYYSSNYDKARYISADVEQQITETQRELSVNQAEYERLRRQSNEFTNSLKSNTVQKNKAQTQRMKTQELICKVQFDINELRNYEEAAPVDVTTLEEEVGVYEDQMDKLTQQKQTAEKDMEKLKNNYKEAIDNFEKVDKKFKELAEKVEPLKDDLNRAHVDVETAKQHKQHYEGKRRDHNAKIVDLKKQYAREEKKTEEATKKAREICPERIDTRRTASNIDSEITQVERRILAEQKK